MSQNLPSQKVKQVDEQNYDSEDKESKDDSIDSYHEKNNNYFRNYNPFFKPKSENKHTITSPGLALFTTDRHSHNRNYNLFGYSKFGFSHKG